MIKLRKTFYIWLFSTMIFVAAPTQEAKPIPALAVILQQAINWVIKAVDLMIQRLQNDSIWLQNVQKVLENKLNDLKLTEIARWGQRQKDLFQKYYDDLWKVRQTLATYQRVSQIVQRQRQLVQQYSFTWQMVNQDRNFSRSEIDYMYVVYTGIINDSLFNLEQLLMAVNAYRVKMTDSKRLEIINKAADGIEKNYSDLQEFNKQNIKLSLSRSKDQHEIESIKKLYGLPTE